MKREIGLFFGSFNPVHIGHMIVAQYIQQHSHLEEVWFIVSPQNPFKNKKTLLSERERFYMVQQAIGDTPGLRASDVEFYLNKPSYTVVTLAHLAEKYPEHSFHLIMGSDNRKGLSKWRNGKFIEENFPIIVYPRGSDQKEDFSNTLWVDAPRMELSASLIRNSIAEGKDVSYMLPHKVWEYADHNNLYKK